MREGAVRVGRPHWFHPLPPSRGEGSEGWGPRAHGPEGGGGRREPGPRYVAVSPVY